jgi:hypothetical protein
MLYLRTYQGFVKIPVVGQWLGQLSNLYNRYVLREDELIITTQYPNYGDLNAGYFIPGDRPIALYLQHRQALIEGSTQSTEPALAISVQAQ